jgi:hypothetical protein
MVGSAKRADGSLPPQTVRGCLLLGKGFDLRLVDDARSTDEAFAQKEIVEVEKKCSSREPRRR